MKKIFRFMAVLATVAAALASCAKAEMDAPANEDAAGENVYQGPTKLLTFVAQTGTPQTRTSLGDVTDGDGKKTQSVLWTNGDKVAVCWKETTLEGETTTVVTRTAIGQIAVDSQSSTATLAVQVPEELEESTVFYAVYPSSIALNLNPNKGEVEYTVPTVTGTFKNANIMLARCSSFADSPVFNFKHACGIIKFTTGSHKFKNGKQVDRISIYNGTRTQFKGTVSFDFVSDNEIEVNTKTVAGDKYVSAKDVDPNSECYVSVLPDTEFPNGIIANFYNEQLSAYTEKSFTVARGEILHIGNIEDRLDDNRNFYFKPIASGNGDASSWENAGDISKFREILTENTDKDLAYAQRLKLDNTNYHFLQGEYQLAEGEGGNMRFDLKFDVASRSMSIPLNIYGGYSQATPSLRDPQKYETVFTGNEQYAILAVRDNVILNIDGIVFADGLADDACSYDKGRGDTMYGAALYTNRLGSDTKLPEVHINNCVFRNNKEKNKSLSDNHGAGAAINIRRGNVYVNNTLFEDNYSYKRGIIHASTSAEGKIYLNACKFTGNGMNSNYGAVIRTRCADFHFAMNGCTFGKNDSDGGWSSQVSIASPNIIVNNTFIENVSLYSNASSAGILRMDYQAETSSVVANNIILDTCTSDLESTRPTVYYSGAYEVNMGFMTNLWDYKEFDASSHKNTDLTGAETAFASSKDEMKASDLGDLEYTDDYLYTWNGNVTDFTYATAAQMIAATKANSIIDDDFYNWLVEIRAIVDGQFTDCRGYLRPKDAMCPGAYDPFATAAE